ncbi:DUF3667 domain-containing protein [Tenacibaculum sp. SG-28]|uniref:DUF3667 domain-containing protein n=1 Tax=Tenacibaculum sp. SG-28 TaxID=754426 RepID=UPI000CF47954|nr:DUF3667 domain-containing protein [Tenacibaculum sp. SG-28]PQJ21136.1 hypothetical protein BSU00_09025 [Tenacibaculum sp. SG-28]
MKCISCDFDHYQKFCPNCGERSGVKKITVSSVWEDALLSITNTDKGILYTVKALLLYPKQFVTDYLSGRRKGILNPISFLVFAITLYLIVISFYDIPKLHVVYEDTVRSNMRKIGNEIGTFIRLNLKYFWILTIFPLAVSLKLTFRKYNFVEYVTISSFIIGQATLLGILSYILFRMPLIVDPVVFTVILWLTYQIFKKNTSKMESFLLTLVALFLFVMQFCIVIVLIGIVQYIL